jgi:hypothetical protein
MTASAQTALAAKLQQVDELLENTRQVCGARETIDMVISHIGAQALGKSLDAHTSTATALLRLAPGTRTDVAGLDFQSVKLEALFMELA